MKNLGLMFLTLCLAGCSFSLINGATSQSKNKVASAATRN